MPGTLLDTENIKMHRTANWPTVEIVFKKNINPYRNNYSMCCNRHRCNETLMEEVLALFGKSSVPPLLDSLQAKNQIVFIFSFSIFGIIPCTQVFDILLT